MIHPEMLNSIDRYYEDGSSTIVDFGELPRFDRDQYDLTDEKSFTHYITDLERIVRMSFEYRQLMNNLRKTKGMDVCSVLDNVTSRDNKKVRIEIHHSPFTLYDICYTVIRKRQQCNEDMNIQLVANEVLYLHWIGLVGLIPLSKTVHDLVHKAYYFIPTDRVRGNYKGFLEMYRDFMTPDLIETIQSVEEATRLYNNQQMQIFNQHRLYVNSNGSYALPRMDEINSLIKDHISNLKSNKRMMVYTVNKDERK